MQRQLIASGAKWEPIAGYSRAVRVGPFVQVAGTTSWDAEGNIVGVGDPYAQAVQILRNIEHALTAAGATRRDVVRTRAFVTDIERWQEVARAHGEFFHDIRPAMTLVQVARLVDPKMMVEIEADAIVGDAPIDG
jgi:enamine deaminase RidA (YjgF/YER057c/UK114 family)